MSKNRFATREKQLTRKQLSRREKEQRLNKLLILGTASLLGIVVLIFAWGLYDQYVRRPRTPVAIVSGVPIRLDTYQRLVRYRRWDYRNYLAQLEAEKQQFDASKEEEAFLVQYLDQQISQIQRWLMNVPSDVLEELIDGQLAREECAKRGITVSPEEVQLRLEAQFGYDRNPPTPVPVSATLPITITPTPTTAPMTREQFLERSAAWLRAMEAQSGFTEQDFRRLLETSLYREKLAEVIGATVPTMTEQIHARHILLATREEAEKALARLQNGEDFAKLAQELSTDTATKDKGGDLGWLPRGKMVAEFDEAAFALQPGQISGIVETQFGFHIIRVEEREANRPLEPSDLEAAKSKAVEEWYRTRRTSPDVVRKWDSTMVPKDITPQARR